MGYRFVKKGAEPFYIRSTDAGAIREAASMFGLQRYMPQPDRHGGPIAQEHLSFLISGCRNMAKVLNELADYLTGAENVEWKH